MKIPTMRLSVIGLLILALAQLAVGQEAAPAESPTAAATPAPQPAPAAPTAAATTPPAVAKPVAKPVDKLPPKPVVIPFDRQPYKISVSLGISVDSTLSNAEATRLVDQLREILAARIGVSWESRVELAPMSEPSTNGMLANLSTEEWTAVLLESPFDKKFALTLDRTGTKFRLSGIEWDKATQTITPLLTRESFDRRSLPTQAADLTLALFRPLVSITAVDGNIVEMKIRGGDFLPPDASLTPFQLGDFITTYIRYSDKKLVLRRIQQVPWSYLRVDLVDRGFMRTTQITPFVSPLAASKRRAESLGLKVNAHNPTSTVSVNPRGKPDSPMAGYRVELQSHPEAKLILDEKTGLKVPDKKEPDTFLKLRTDRMGRVTIPVDPTNRLQSLVVYSGVAPLAKVPIIPGYASEMRLDVPDDSTRLNVEAETELLQSELVDIVARRHVMMARARGAGEKGNFEQVTEFQKQIAELPTLALFEERIEKLRLPGIQAARDRRDKAQESRITKLCNKIKEQAIEHLSPEMLSEFDTEMAELKKTK